MVAVAPPLLKQFVFWGERFVGNEAVFSTPLYLLVGNDFYSKIIGKFVETIYIHFYNRTISGNVVDSIVR